nr:DMT family transporter [Aestuariivirga litoralis]
MLFTSSFLLGTMVDVPAKLLQFHGASISTTVFIRYIIALMLLTALFVSRREWPARNNIRLNLFRGLLLTASTFLNFYAVSKLPLALTVSINFASPLISCALAPLILGEHVGPRRWAAVCVGFIGMLIVIRPGADSFHPAMLASLCNALVGAFYQIYTRKAGASTQPETGLLWVFGVGSVLAGIAVLGEGFTPPSPNWLWLVALLMGVAGLATHMVMTRGLALAPASLLAPFAYTQLIWMVVSGVVLFGDWPDKISLLGAAIIIASGIYVWHRERVTGSEAASVTLASD